MPTYLVERYLPGCDRVWLEAALTRLPEARCGVAHLGSWYVPSDECCFCTFDAPDAERVRLVNELARVPFARITEAYEIGAARSDHKHEGGSA